ncbi:MAG: hypothetical protein WDK95_14980, partial [Syntrophorhabdaceae bacterium]
HVAEKDDRKIIPFATDIPCFLLYQLRLWRQDTGRRLLSLYRGQGQEVFLNGQVSRQAFYFY